ncbi:hypothetical protein BH11PSE9_BH11PSE9_13210 [soil metagenome]
MLSMTISPNGKLIAAIGFNGKLSAGLVIDADTLEARVLVNPEQIRRNWIYTRVPTAMSWLSDTLLAVDFNDRDSEVMNLSGKKITGLGERFIRTMSVKGSATPWALVYRNIDSGDIDLVDPVTRERKAFRVSLPGKLRAWAFDAQGALRAVTMMDTAFWSDKSKLSNWYRADESSPWQLLEEAPVTEALWTPIFVPQEPGTLIVRSDKGRDTNAIFAYDIPSRSQGQLMVGHPRQDILAAQGLEAAVFGGVVTEGLKRETHWFEPRWAALQASVDAALPQRVNILSDDSGGRILVFSHGDVDPGRWYVLDIASSRLREVGQVKPDIDPATMRPMETLDYKSGDGLTIPAYLTRPKGVSGPAPLVVLIHGGPNVRDHWGWDPEVQLLAANGYAVFQPQFRGSTGFGRSFEHAGYGQWGLAMQDDITDGVKYLVAKGMADPERICIVGASYGGYAALWGVVKTPDLYKCAVTFAGVTDIEYMLKDWSDTNSSAVAREIQLTRVGDAAKDKARFGQVSPLKQAGRIKVPLLIAHGDEDERVPISHSRKLMDALKENGKTFEWLPLKGEGHGFTYVANQRKYYAAVLKFLDQNIGSQSKATTAAVLPKANASEPVATTAP